MRNRRERKVNGRAGVVRLLGARSPNNATFPLTYLTRRRSIFSFPPLSLSLPAGVMRCVLRLQRRQNEASPQLAVCTVLRVWSLQVGECTGSPRCEMARGRGWCCKKRKPWGRLLLGAFIPTLASNQIGWELLLGCVPVLIRSDYRRWEGIVGLLNLYKPMYRRRLCSYWRGSMLFVAFRLWFEVSPCRSGGCAKSDQRGLESYLRCGCGVDTVWIWRDYGVGP